MGMKFDNAFLTANGKVGLQYKQNGIIISAWPDKKGILQVSDGLDRDVETQLRLNYTHHAKKYGKVA